jgi:hypothetical protein
LLAALLLAPMPALGWGVEGHEIVAAVALRELTPAARAQVAHLLGADVMLVHDSNWADEIKDQRRDTGRWHFVDIPLSARGYEPGRDCAGGDCVVAQIGNDLRILSDRRQSDAVRAQGLRFLIHFVADIHQPLHAEDNNDKGGNAVRVRLGHERTNLHRVWDVDVVEAQGFDVERVAAGIEHSLSPAQRKAWAQGSPAQWANEAHAIAREQIYPPLMGREELRLPNDYAWREAPLARMLLAKAGVRLAWLLNNTLK